MNDYCGCKNNFQQDSRAIAAELTYTAETFK